MLKHIIRSTLRRMGLELQRYTPHHSEHSARSLMLSRLGIDLVLDVGANTGQYAAELLHAGFKGQIISFEPQTEAHAKVSEQARSHRSGRWRVHSRCAIGAETGTSLLKVSANSVSSSLLPVLSTHVNAAPQSATIGAEPVDVVRLDDVAFDPVQASRATMVKIDTQGFEWQVLDGAPRILEISAAVQVEVSLVPLYGNQHLWRDVVDRLEALGFQLFFAFPAFADSVTGQTLQWDATFVRKSGVSIP